MEIEKLTRYNEWWATGAIRANLLGKKRKMLAKLLSLMEKREILLITGLRQVGKTTLIYQIVQALLEKGTAPEKILYFSFDDESVGLDDLIKTYEEKIIKARLNQERLFLFLDEIQKLEGWESKVKMYYDLYPNLKFILSGSAYVSLGKNSAESLAGRVIDIFIPTLTFLEFLEWKNASINLENLEASKPYLLPLFNDYLRKGGFPALVGEEDGENIRRHVKNNVIERIIYKDLPEEFGVRDTALLKALVEMAASNPGMLLNYDSLSKDLGRSRITITNYIHYLEYSLILRTLSNYRKGFIVSSRKLRKLYLNNTSIAYAIVDDFYSDKFMEKAYENFAVIDTNAKNYYRNKYEVDIILKRGSRAFPIEVKHGNTDKGSIMNFLNESGLDLAYLFTKDSFGEFSTDGKKITEMPVWAFSLTKDELLGKVFGVA